MSKVAIVTGASRGIGRSIALSLAENGCDIAVIYAGNDEAADKTAAECALKGVRAIKYKCDVSNLSECESAVAQITSELGAPSVLINNAGVTRDMLTMRMKEADFDRVIDVNLKGAFCMIKACFRSLMRAQNGRIINISSVAGLSGNAGQANYSASKAGLIGLTKSIAKELAPRGVTCNAIAPGLIETDMTDVLPEGIINNYISAIPLGRAGSADEVAELAVFLASDKAAYITGAIIPIDGGMSM